MNDRPTQAKIFFVSSRERMKETRRKSSRKHIWGLCFVRDGEEEEDACNKQRQRETFFMLPLFGVSKHLKSPSDRVMNCQSLMKFYDSIPSTESEMKALIDSESKTL